MLYFTLDTIVPADDSLQSDNETCAAKIDLTGFCQYPQVSCGRVNDGIEFCICESNQNMLLYH